MPNPPFPENTGGILYFNNISGKRGSLRISILIPYEIYNKYFPRSRPSLDETWHVWLHPTSFFQLCSVNYAGQAELRRTGRSQTNFPKTL